MVQSSLMRQRQALQVMLSGNNTFLTGAPGAGKTYVLNDFINRSLRLGKRIAVTASTGIAASHIGGTTIHSWSGLGILDFLSEEDKKRLGNSEKLIKRYNGVDILVIDEVSMLHGARLDMISTVAKMLRKSDKPFGGMQVILVGDLFQLPPVSRGVQKFDFIHNAEAWQELDLKICYITEQHRQTADDQLLKFLELMRSSELNEINGEIVTSRVGLKPKDGQVITRLYSHNIDVESINKQHLDAIPTAPKTFQMQTKGSSAKVEQLTKGLLANEVLELKIGAEVMFVANNFAEGYVNGSRGQIIDFDNSQPVVELNNGRIVVVEPHNWSLNEDGKIRAEVWQLPLRLAWAITIHKSQGMSLDAAEIDLSRAFTPGMGYVALSRVRSLGGLYLKGLNNMAMTMNPDISELDNQLRTSSTTLATVTPDAEEPTEQDDNSDTPEQDDTLLNKLKLWRREQSQDSGVAAYMVASNKALEAAARIKPQTTTQLLGVPGFGAKKVEQFGQQIIDIINPNN